MIYGIYSIQDCKTGFLSIFTDINDSAAIRNFKHACANEGSLYYTFGQDYTLYKLGDFDTDNGNIDLCTREALVTGVNNIGTKLKEKE